jgi:hypothetical protein
MDISILIPTLTTRRALFEAVLQEVRRQISEVPEINVEVLWEEDNREMTLGAKRNLLMDRCNGKYHCFVDDDDILAPYFLKSFVPMIQSGIDYDCASFVGAHYEVGKFKKLFNHSLYFKEWFETDERYFRSPSPMNMLKTSIVRQIRYKDIRDTEDHEFSKRLVDSGLLKTEFEVNPNRPLYHYVDRVKEDREKWKYMWEGDFIRLYRIPEPVPPSKPNPPRPLAFLKISRG